MEENKKQKKVRKVITESKNGHFKMSIFENPKYFCEFFYQKSYASTFFSVIEIIRDFMDNSLQLSK